MKYYIIAGEASGDLHAANLIKGIKAKDKDADIRAWGGDLMEAQGANVVKHFRDLAFMGFLEVLMNLKTILGNIKWCKRDIQDFQPDMLILVDYPGFNLRIASFAKELGVPVFYYISPQIWAWKESRVKQIKSDVDKMYCILPFEKDFYKKHNYEAHFVGHPLLDAIAQFKLEEKGITEGADSRKMIALLPGSRKQEIAKMLPVMADVVDRFPNYRFVLAVAPSMDVSFYEEFVGAAKNSISFAEGKTYDLLKKADAALVTSGTATLETALFRVPEIVCYKTSKVSYFLAKQLVKIKYISLVNLIVDKMIVPELIQSECNADRIEIELLKILSGESREKMLSNYDELIDRLGGIGASQKTANLMLTHFEEIKKNKNS